MPDSPAYCAFVAAVERRDAAAKAAYEAQWQRFQHKVEAARQEWMAELANDNREPAPLLGDEGD